MTDPDAPNEEEKNNSTLPTLIQTTLDQFVREQHKPPKVGPSQNSTAPLPRNFP